MYESIVYISLIAHLGACFLIYIGWVRIRPLGEPVNEPVSVIIAAHNEAENLKRNLSYVLGQSHENFEVIVVLDRCSDGSEQVLRDWERKDKRLRFVKVKETPEGWAPKKHVLRVGIEMARHEVLAFTDADCRPGQDWLKGIVARMGEGANLVLGVSPYRKEKGFLNTFIRFETFYALFQYIGLAQVGMPYMGVGRNIAYRKEHYTGHDGLESVKGMLSGDDDLLVNHFAHPALTAVLTDPGSQVESDPKTSFRGWIRQKMRHVSASSAYKPLSQFILATFHGAHAIFYVSLIVYFCVGFQWVNVLALFTAQCMFKALLMWMLDRKWKIGGISWLFPAHDFLFFLYNLILVPAGLLVKPKWR